jgi:hypothetical protein
LVERQQEIKQKLKENDNSKLEEMVKNTNQVALKAIQKELDLEQLIKKEEQECEAREEKDLQIAMDQEKKKSEYLLQAIKEKKLENQFNQQAKQYENEVEGIKQTAAQEVQNRRNKFKEMIAKMRLESQNRRNQIKQQILTMKYQVTESFTDANKKGDKNTCLNVIKNPSDIKLYCIAKYSKGDTGNLNKCNTKEEFCNMCCNAEFGDFYDNLRQECKEQICNNPSNAIKDINSTTGSADKGAWVWTKT